MCNIEHGGEVTINCMVDGPLAIARYLSGMRLKLNKKRKAFLRKNIQGHVQFFLKYCTCQMRFPGFYLVICTSDVLVTQPPPPPPPISLQIG